MKERTLFFILDAHISPFFLNLLPTENNYCTINNYLFQLD